MVSETERVEEAEWKRLRRLGLKDSLRERGANLANFNWIINPAAANGPAEERTFDFQEILPTNDGESGCECVLLATLGQNGGQETTTTIDHLHVSPRHVQVDVGSGITVLQNLTVGEREFGALWVNLAKNSNIRKLTVYTEMQHFGEANCDRFRRFHEALFSRGPGLGLRSALRSLNIYSSTMHEWCPESGTVPERPMPPNILKGLLTSKCLKSKRSIRYLGMTAFSEDIEGLAAMVSTTSTLRGLTVKYVPVSAGDGGEVKDPEILASAIRKNSSLESFEFEFAATRQLLDSRTKATADLPRTLLAPFTHAGEESNGNSTVKNLFLSDLDSSAVKGLQSMLRRNRTLKALGLRHSHLKSEEWIAGVLHSLQDNATLEHLDLSYGSGLTKDVVFEELMSLLRFHNTTLQSILLKETELESKVGDINEQLRINKEYGTCLAKLHRIAPRAGRIVLCGSPFAGKTCIRKTWQRVELYSKGWRGLFRCLPLSGQLFRQGAFWQHHPGLRQLFFGRGVHQELRHRTRGLEITFIGKSPDITSIWDLAGQEEFHALHDYVFPNAGNSCFVYVFSAIHSPNDDGLRSEKKADDIRRECRYWLRFITSNSKRYGQSQRPSVTFVMTNVDSLTAGETTQFNPHEIVREFKREFDSLLDISEPVEIIDARSTHDVEQLIDVLKVRLATTLESAKEYEVCSKVRDCLLQWRSKNPSKPILTFRQAGKICGHGSLPAEIRSLAANFTNRNQEMFDKGLEIVLKYLNDAGDIIFVEGNNFMIVQVDWFGREVLGKLIDPFEGTSATEGYGICGWFLRRRVNAGTLHHENGRVRRSTLDAFLKKSLHQAVLHERLVDLMIHLKMCFPEPGQESLEIADRRYFFPAILAKKGGRDHASASRALEWRTHISSANDSSSRVCYVGRRLQCEDESLTCLSPGFFPRLLVVLWKYFDDQKWLDTHHFEVSQTFIRFAHDGMQVIVEYSEDTHHFVDILVKSVKGFSRTTQFIRDHVDVKIREFCKSPQGCPGVNLVEGVIRPACVERPLSCKEREDHSVLVSSLKKEKRGHIHMWGKPIRGAPDSDYVADLLAGRSRAVSTRSRTSDLPSKFYFSIDDVTFLQRFGAVLNLGKKTPVKIHICCDGNEAEGVDEVAHKVDGQLGRVLHLAENSKKYHIPILKIALVSLWEGSKTAAGFFNVNPPKQIDIFIDKLVRDREIDIDIATLREISLDRESAELSSEDILRCLDRYAQVSQDAEWLKQFLRLQDREAFYRDFKLRKVAYPNKEGHWVNSWVCEEHLGHFMQQRDN